MRLPFLLASLASLAAAPAAPAAAVGVLPLVPGAYVAADVPCTDPPFAALRMYDGHGLASAHSRDCRARIVRRRGRTVTLLNDCIGAGAGPAPRDTERLTIRIASATRFRTAAQTFRLCPSIPVQRSSAGSSVRVR